MELIDEKVNVSKEIYYANKNNDMIMMYSGGKDSNVIFDLLFECGQDLISHVKVVYIDLGCDFKETELLIKEKSQIIPIEIYKTEHTVLERMFIKDCGVMSWFCNWCTGMKISTADKIKRKYKDCKYIVGVRKNESQRRQRKHDNGAYTNYITPILEWNEDDVWDYLLNRSPLKKINKYLDTIYHTYKIKRSGCIFCPLGNNKNLTIKSVYELWRYLNYIPSTLTKHVENKHNYFFYVEDKLFLKIEVYEKILEMVRACERELGTTYIRYSDDEIMKLLLKQRAMRLDKIKHKEGASS